MCFASVKSLVKVPFFETKQFKDCTKYLETAFREAQTSDGIASDGKSHSKHVPISREFSKGNISEPMT